MPCRAVWVEGELRRVSLLLGENHQGAPGILIGSGAGMKEMAADLGQRSAGG